MAWSKITVVIFLAFSVICKAIPHDASSDLRNCALKGPSDIRYWREFPLEIDFNRWSVREVYLFEVGSDQMFSRAINGFGYSMTISSNSGDKDMDVALVYTDACMSCARIHFGSGLSWNTCPDNIRSIPCPLSLTVVLNPPALCGNQTVGSVCDDRSQWQCALGECVHQGPWVPMQCGDLFRRDFFPAKTLSSSIQLGFRLTDCLGSMLGTLAANDIVIKEGDIELLPIETNQRLIRIEGNENFVQLMISMCPRTALVLDELIFGLHEFLTQLDLSFSHVALTAFDGARGYVDLVLFTRNETILRQSFEELRNYTSRDASCNVKEALSAKLNVLTSYLFGLQKDRTHFVVFTASADIVNFVSEETITIPVSNFDISTYLIGWNIPAAQQSLMRAIGRSMYYNTDSSADIFGFFSTIAQQITIPMTSDYIFGYCSPARSGNIDALISWNISGTELRLQGLHYDSSQFTSGCDPNKLLHYCSPRTSNLDGGNIICYDAFNSSSATIQQYASFVQVLLRYPTEPNVTLQLPFASNQLSAHYDVYIRKGGIANPLLYDIKFGNYLATTTFDLSEWFSAGDLVGVHVNFKDNAYDYKKPISIAGMQAAPPLQPPGTSQPSVVIVQPPVYYAPVPIFYPPIGVNSPISVDAPAVAGLLSSSPVRLTVSLGYVAAAIFSIVIF